MAIMQMPPFFFITLPSKTRAITACAVDMFIFDNKALQSAGLTRNSVVSMILVRINSIASRQLVSE